MTVHEKMVRLLLSVLALCLLCLLGETAFGQGTIQAGSQRPFVTGLRPVVGPGVVGGVKVDAKGIVRLATADDAKPIKTAREKALRQVPGNLARPGKLRKVSLRRLNAALLELKKTGKPITDAMRHLAGLQRIRYVFVYPERNDIVLAGAAEGWKVNDAGEVVGATTGRPPLLLDDLIVMLRNARATKVATMSCSIDPTRKGVVRLQNLLRRKGLRINRSSLAAMERTLGPQSVTFEGIPSTTQFAHVMLAADVRMKRLAMGLESSPITGLPSYIQLLRDAKGPPPRNSMPRWWLAPHYEPLRKGARGLAWELRGRGVKAVTEKRSHALARTWAAAFSEKYEELSAQIPVFSRLQNCMDLAVVSALMTDYELMKVAGIRLELMMDAKQLQTVNLPTPSTLASHATATRKGRSWIISVSGGIELNPWKALDKPNEWKDAAEYRKIEPKKTSKRWWWD